MNRDYARLGPILITAGTLGVVGCDVLPIWLSISEFLFFTIVLLSVGALACWRRWQRLLLGAVVALALLAGAFYAAQITRQVMGAQVSEPYRLETTAIVEGLSLGVGPRWRQWVQTPRGRMLLNQPFGQADGWPMRAGETWQVTLQVRPIRGRASEGAFSVERWLASEHAVAQATVQQAQRSLPATGWRTAIDGWRLSQREQIQALTYGGTDSRSILLGLLTGDQALIAPPLQTTYRHLGLSHLLAISGPHVVLLASVVMALVIKVLNCWPRVYRRLPRERWYWSGLLPLATLYALLAGGGVPALRTVLMLTTVTMAVWLRVRPAFGLSIALALMLMLDPMVRWGAGLWLSFGAVWLVTRVSQATARRDRPPQPLSRWQSIRQSIWKTQKIAFRTQALLTVLMLPLALGVFGQVSLWSLPVNLVAIPFLGGLIVPLDLLGSAVSLVSPEAGAWVWALPLSLLDGWHEGLTALVHWQTHPFIQWVWQGQALIAATALLALMVAPWRLWQAKRWGWVGLWVIAALLAVVYWPEPSPRVLQVTALDTAQGQSVWLQSKHHNALVHADRLNHEDPQARIATDESAITAPALTAHGVQRLDTAVIQPVNDVTGDRIGDVLAQMPATRIWALAPYADSPAEARKRAVMTPCAAEAQQNWADDGITLTVLTPWPEVPDLPVNERGCSVLIEAQDGALTRRVLVVGQTGPVTQAMLRLLCRVPPIDVLVIPAEAKNQPHDREWMDQLAPKLILQTGRPTPFGPKTLAALPYPVVSINQWGSTRVSLDQPDVAWQSERNQKPWFGLLPPTLREWLERKAGYADVSDGWYRR